jgi:hypothetical protein
MEAHETILRFLGYGIEFFQVMAAPMALAAMTWRVSR